MRFSLEFIKEFFDPKRSAQGIAHLLTMAGLEIEHLEKKDGDWIFDAEVTPNRNDLLSIFGIAKELACLCNKYLDVKLCKYLGKPLLKDIDIYIRDIKDCPVYIARLIRGAKIESSPSWLKHRIVNCGLSSINNVVDITNYCMLKWGNPLHAFDFDKIEGNVYVRRANQKEIFVGLDDKERLLCPTNLVISDDKKVIALAGVMGAKNTEVDFTTKNILLEAAVFSPLTVRRSHRSAGIDTDSSYRFERTVLGKLLEVASSEAAKLICEICDAKTYGYRKRGREPVPPKKKIIFSLANLNAYIGEKFPKNDVRRILKNLGFKVKILSRGKLLVKPSVFRLDIARDVDVFEEITRIYGYNRIKGTLPALACQLDKDNIYILKNDLRKFLINLGLNEVITYSLNSEENLLKLKESHYIKLTNPLRSQEDVLRTHLLVGMLEAVKYNFNQKNQFLRFFEIANIYKKDKDAFSELPFLSCAVTEKAGGFFYLKGLIEEVLSFLNIKGYAFLEKSRDNFLNSLIVNYKDRSLGFLGKLNKNIKEDFGLTDNLYFAQLDITLMESLKKDNFYEPFSKYPVVFHDISLDLKKDLRFEEIEKILKETVQDYLLDYQIVDIYRTKDAPSNLITFTIRIFYQSKEKTLTSQEVDFIHNNLRKRLSQRQGIILR